MKQRAGTLRRTFALAAVAALAVAGLAAPSAAADPGPVSPVSPVEVAIAEQTDSRAGVLHDASITFTGFGCTFRGRSTHQSAATAIVSGNCRQPVMVRIFACNSSGACGTSAWRRSSAGEVTIDAPANTQIRWSQHKCGDCVIVHRIDH